MQFSKQHRLNKEFYHQEKCLFAEQWTLRIFFLSKPCMFYFTRMATTLSIFRPPLLIVKLQFADIVPYHSKRDTQIRQRQCGKRQCEDEKMKVTVSFHYYLSTACWSRLLSLENKRTSRQRSSAPGPRFSNLEKTHIHIKF